MGYPNFESGLNFAKLRQANVERCAKWFPDGGVDHWSLNDWFVEVLGELGEAANYAKKIKRDQDGVRGNRETLEELQAKLRLELADAVITLDLLAARAGVDLGEVVPEKFNIVSERNGFPERL